MSTDASIGSDSKLRPCQAPRPPPWVPFSRAGADSAWVAPSRRSTWPDGRCSAGYWVAAPARRQGVARRALRLLCRYAFDELDVRRIELWIDPNNAASLAVAEAVGFTREGLLRSFMPIQGQRRDMLMYSLLPGELA